MSFNIKTVLCELSNKVDIGNFGEPIEEYLYKFLNQYTSDVTINMGNVIAKFGKRQEGRPHILLDAHIDQIGMIVTYITDDGFIKISNVGGLDRRLLPAQEVTIHGKKDILGIVSTLPPHLKSNKDEVPTIDELCIDTGYSKEQLERLVSLGDVISFRKDFISLANDRVSGISLDDRCGIVAILKAIETLQHLELNCSYSVLFSAQEEVGERGALIGAYEINPDYAIAVDVSFGLTADEKPHKCGNLGGGAMVGFAPTLDKTMSKNMVDIAKECGMPYQIEVMSGQTGTNADRFSVTRKGVKTVTLSIPLKYMHTPVEVIDLNDIQHTANLIVEYVKRLH